MVPGSSPGREADPLPAHSCCLLDLIVQAPEIGAAQLGTIADLAKAQGIHVLHGGDQQAYRLTRVASRAGVPEACRETSWDWAFVDADMRLDSVRVVAMDMDSTLITIECVDEIADFLGIKPEVAAITASAMRGEIDFAASLTRRVALLAGLPVATLERVYDERLRLSAGAERMLAGFKRVGAKTLLVSGGFTFFTERLRTRLGLDEAMANVLEVEDGKLTGRISGGVVDANAKAQRLQMMRECYASDGGLVIAIGDGANDVPMMKRADVSIAYHAKSIVRAEAIYAIDYCGLDAVLNLFD